MLTKVKKQLVFSQQSLKLANRKAYRLGLNFGEYIRHLIAKDVEADIEDIPMVDEETEKAIGRALKDYEEGRTVRASTAEEITAHLQSL